MCVKNETGICELSDRLKKVEDAQCEQGLTQAEQGKDILKIQFELENMPKMIRLENELQMTRFEKLLENTKTEIIDGHQNKQLEDKEKTIERNFKWTFWIITTILGVVITTIVLSFLNSN